MAKGIPVAAILVPGVMLLAIGGVIYQLKGTARVQAEVDTLTADLKKAGPSFRGPADAKQWLQQNGFAIHYFDRTDRENGYQGIETRFGVWSTEAFVVEGERHIDSWPLTGADRWLTLTVRMKPDTKEFVDSRSKLSVDPPRW